MSISYRLGARLTRWPVSSRSSNSLLLAACIVAIVVEARGGQRVGIAERSMKQEQHR